VKRSVRKKLLRRIVQKMGDGPLCPTVSPDGMWYHRTYVILRGPIFQHQDVSVFNGRLAQIHAHIPVTRELVANIGGKNYYAQNDIVGAYYQFRVHPSVSELYAFSTHMGNFEYCEILPQGEKNAPAWTNNAMAHIFAPLQEVHTYFDDHVISSDDSTALLNSLEKYLEFCLQYNIKLSRKKAKVGYPAINAPGFIISKQDKQRKDNYFPVRTFS